MPLEKLTRARIIEALNLLGERALQEQVVLELCIYGGSAMMLAYNARDATRDIDAIVRPSEPGQRLAKAVAEELGLDESWLNDKVFLLRKMGIRTLNQIEEHIERFYPYDTLTTEARKTVETLLGTTNAE